MVRNWSVKQVTPKREAIWGSEEVQPYKEEVRFIYFPLCHRKKTLKIFSTCDLLYTIYILFQINNLYLFFTWHIWLGISYLFLVSLVWDIIHIFEGLSEKKTLHYKSCKFSSSCITFKEPILLTFYGTKCLRLKLILEYTA